MVKLTAKPEKLTDGRWVGLAVEVLGKGTFKVGVDQSLKKVMHIAQALGQDGMAIEVFCKGVFKVSMISFSRAVAVTEWRSWSLAIGVFNPLIRGGGALYAPPCGLLKNLQATHIYILRMPL